jgi:hypothetical protein
MTHDQPPDENWEWETPEQRRPRRLDEETDDVGFPIVWVLIGGLAGLLTIGLIALGVVQLVRKDKPEPTPTILPTLALPATPTVASLMEDELTPTLEPTLIPSPTPLPVIETPTPIPPTPTTMLQAPTQLAPDTYAKIVNTGGQGLSMRAGPGTNNARLKVADADTTLYVVEGPSPDEQGDSDGSGTVYSWWYVRDTDGTEGWCRGDFLAPTLAPE